MFVYCVSVCLFVFLFCLAAFNANKLYILYVLRVNSLYYTRAGKSSFVTFHFFGFGWRRWAQ